MNDSNDNTAYNLRQYRQIEGIIESFRRGDMDFAKLVGDIEALILSLQDIPNDWRNSLLSTWGVLEEIYAFALDQGSHQLDHRQAEAVYKTLDKLEAMLNAEKGKKGSEPN